MSDPVTNAATHTGANATALLLLAAFLAVVVYQGNLGALAAAAEQDFIGGSGHPAFWKWGAAIVVLYGLATWSKTNYLFGPILVIVIVAMLIELAEAGQLKPLAQTIQGFFKQG